MSVIDGPGSGAEVDRDAEAHDQVSDPQARWARDILDRLGLEGSETVLDAGCGSGRVTQMLLERLPRGKVIAADSSPSMIDHARRRIGDDDRVRFHNVRLTELDLSEEIDVVVSNASFHWISDHLALFGRLHRALKPGGKLDAQCGGEGNVAEWSRALMSASGDERFVSYLRGLTDPWHFASVGDTESLLARVGFLDVRCWLERHSVSPPNPREYVRKTGLARHLEHLPPELHDEFIDAILGSMPRPLRIEYVRLNIQARKGDR